MLAENFGAAKLADTAVKIEADSLAYRELYTECYDALEASTAGSIDVAVLGGIASVGKRLGRAIAETPVGEHIPINEALEGAGEGIGRYNKKQSERLMAKLLQAKTPDIAPFRQSVMEIDALFNRPTRIAIDAENVYILPAEQQEE